MWGPHGPLFFGSYSYHIVRDLTVLEAAHKPMAMAAPSKILAIRHQWGALGEQAVLKIEKLMSRMDSARV